MTNLKDAILKKLTIVICSYNRHIYLKRTIKYFSKFNLNLVILDGSDFKLRDPCINSENVRYIYNKKKGFYDRLLTSPNYINTEFMILGCDDEFYLPSSLKSCVKFLLNQPSFSSCGGRALGFSTDEKNIYGIEQYPKLKNIKLDHDSTIERIELHFANYVPAHMYSVMRTINWKIICKYVFEKEYSFFAAMEMQIEFLNIVSGKSKIIQELLWMRNKEVPGIRGTGPSMSQSMTISNWWSNKIYKNEKDDFLFRMKNASKELSQNQNLVISEDTISKIFENYIFKFLATKPFSILFVNFKRLIPYKIKKIIKLFLLKKIKLKNLTQEVNTLELEGVKVDYKDLDLIISSLKYSINNK